MRKILVLNSSISLTHCEFNPTGEGGRVDITVMIWFIWDTQPPGSKRILVCFCPFQIEPWGSNRVNEWSELSAGKVGARAGIVTGVRVPPSGLSSCVVLAIKSGKKDRVAEACPSVKATMAEQNVQLTVTDSCSYREKKGCLHGQMFERRCFHYLKRGFHEIS